MIHKIYTLQWISLSIGVLFLVITIYTLFRNVKRDKIIAMGIFVTCLFIYLFSTSIITSHNKKAEKYIGTYKLKNYNNSKDFIIEICYGNKYYIYNDIDTVKKGEWKFRASKDKLDFLLIGKDIFGINELEIE